MPGVYISLGLALCADSRAISIITGRSDNLLEFPECNIITRTRTPGLTGKHIYELLFHWLF